MSRSDYEALEKPSPHVFYYIYEDEYKLTHKPREGEYDNVEDYQNALKDWENQLKELDQQYLAASWGLEIENSLRTKASNESLNKLAEEVAGIKGGGEGASLESLKAEVEGLQTSTQDLEGRINVILTTSEDGTDTGRIVDLETSIQDINDDLDNYVTRTELTGEGSDDFKFVTKS
jgi:hypothetical protein